MLAEHFFRKFRRETMPEEIELLTTEAKEALQSYSWPGNVRELANVIEHAAILCDSVPVRRDDLPAAFDRRRSSPKGFGAGPVTLKDLEQLAIRESLQRHQGSKSKAAEELGISLKTLYNKVNQSSELGKSA